MLDFARIDATPLESEPYPYLIVHDVLIGDDLAALPGELPQVSEGGAHPVAEVAGGPRSTGWSASWRASASANYSATNLRSTSTGSRSRRPFAG